MKIFKLIYNELVKQFKKPSIKIIYSLILVSAIVLPMVISKIPQDKYMNNALESNKFLLQQAKENTKFYEDDKSIKGKMSYKYSLIEEEYMKLFVDNKIGLEDWREQQTENFKESAYKLASIEFAIAGYNQDVVMQNLIGTDPNVVGSYYKMSFDKKKEVQAQLILEKEKQKSIIENKDYNSYTQEEITKKHEYILQHKKTIKEYEKLKVKSLQSKDGKAKLEKLKKESKDAEKSIEEFNQDIKILQFRLNNDINYDLNNWKNNAIVTIQKEIQDLRVELMSEKQYALTATQQGYYLTYDEYVKNYREQKEKRIETIKRIWYGLENNISDLNDVRDARSVVDGTYEIYIILAIVMVIIMGGGIIASEFSKGTIRLLLIRPVSRWKILLSKLLSILLVGFSIVALGTGILYITSGYVFGFDAYKIPLLETVNGSIIHIDFMKFLISKVLLSSSSLLFISVLVFSISTLAKNTALAVGISMILYLGVGPTVDLLISMKQTWVINTLIPYINASYFRLIPMTSQSLEQGFGLQMQYNWGAIQLLIASLIMLVITFVVFVKKDVKN
ncbi:MAG TPA: bacitracin ABC transporter permease [Terrisporobacter glycolicus]|uniref:ABC transporter permease subunit n=1 Tax=Terrisporobacter TaxID=1505652 RepID=UPI000E9403C4|nr:MULTISPECIES: ABC transporter permease subunit [Terrisporobacter]MBN9648142.1 ABC transporter permease subunit [Terrisporobacter glycolicus]HBI93212.1 bacitracin ABC transporter permease [Terrisporobacter hibernicus]